MIIVMSGAAGLIGGEVTAQLQAAGHGVIALVHRNPAIIANDGRTVETSAWAGKIPCGGEVITLSASIDEPRLGLDPATIQTLAADTDLVLHCAALTAFDAAPEAYQTVNIDGTSHMLALAPRAGFLQVSTAYVCGTKEGAIAEAPRDPAYGFSNGYEASKDAAEALVRAAGAAGRAVAIARPSVVLGAYGCGTIRSFDTFYAVFRLLAEGRVSVLPAQAHATLDFVPIDHVVGGIIDIIDHWPRAVGKTFHLTSGNPVRVADFYGAMASYPHFAPPAFVAPADFSSEALPPREKRLYARAVAQYMGYFARSPSFVTGELAALSGRICPPMDGAALRRMIDYAIGRGFLKSS